MTETTAERTGWVWTLCRRWPTALAIGTAAVFLAGDGSDGLADRVGGFAEALLVLPLEYLILARLRRRGASWPVSITAIVVLLTLQALDLVSPAAVLVSASLLVMVWGAVRAELRKPGMFRVQVLGAVGFGALALTGLSTDPAIGLYLVAAGWFFHGIWDYIHLRLDKVVSRSYAEWCGVLDILIAAQLILLA
jgi:hypothetical protein